MQPAALAVDAARDLVAGVRSHGRHLLARADDPHAELMALVWGSRFDREHAHGLLAAYTPGAPDLLRRLLQAADSFDRLPAPRQAQLRRLILRHRGRWGAAGRQ